MTDGTDAADDGWFAGVAPDDVEAGADAIVEGTADEPRDWPAEAVEAGFADDREGYYDALREATIRAAREEVQAQERAGDRQLLHAVRAMDDADRTANELAERVAEWAGTLFEDVGEGVEGAREVANRDPENATERRVIALAERVTDLDEEGDDLRTYIERTAPEVAPNLSALAGSVLAARLISLAGGLESLAKMPSGTVQVLGAEEALFAHLRGRAPSPKHGVIYTHEAVRNTVPEERGSAARALAGKLAIAARADHYTGKRRTELDEQLRERIERIRARTDEGGDGE